MPAKYRGQNNNNSVEKHDEKKANANEFRLSIHTLHKAPPILISSSASQHSR